MSIGYREFLAMSTPTPPEDRLDRDTPETIRLRVDEATELGARALHRLGFADDEVRIIVDQLVDNALCGYPFASLPRILAIAQDAKTRQPRGPVRVVHETPVSALLDGGNNVGYVAVYRATQLTIEKARTHQSAVVGVYNSYYSGRNAYYMEMIAEAGLVGIHLASGQPRVVPLGGTRPALGTNPLCFGFPSAHGAVIFDMGTAALQWGEVLLHSHLGYPCRTESVSTRMGAQRVTRGKHSWAGSCRLGGTKALASHSWCRPWAFWPGPHSPGARCRITGFSSSLGSCVITVPSVVA